MVRPGATVYEKDLGANTAEIAGTMTADNLGPSWKFVSQEP
jgi:hypothetical protein